MRRYNNRTAKDILSWKEKEVQWCENGMTLANSNVTQAPVTCGRMFLYF